ncbi:NmrA-like family domain-containing protein 1 [Diaporthe amygdali]|uniref:NmrA-like family domain-containing protein 1 n=1 Tax=Phomopsis amygdali TaxID=1214568 RepID=UPI0022FE59E7|nr:NmrA-like family domain-containing protein 1 [Diaporthe amygdali]KAJ0110272.1 NmrA-like family domain-containing protein 1 [Diaporthe amygdali]
MSPHAKAIPRSILIFGASGHIGRPLTEFLMLEAPSIRLRLATSNESKIAPLQNDFPKAEVVHADYYNPGSISAAVAAMEGIFVLPSSGLREEKPMTDLVRALKQSETVTQVIRLMGLFPEFPPACIAFELGPGSLPAEHRVAKDILDGSGLPVTYVNCGATFMDNLFILMRSVSAKKTLVWPEHRVPFLDPRDIAEVVGRLFLSTSAGHIGAFHTMNNGHDLLNFEEVAGIISEVFDEPVGYDGSWEEFAGFYDSIMGRDKVQWLWRFFKFEEAHEEIWALNNFVERTIGRKPVTVRQWLLEHKDELQRGSAYLGWAGRGR